jgi:hypothetical protein
MNVDAKFILDEIKQQRKLSDQVTKVVLDALMDIYYPSLSPDEIRFSEIGSYGRGTNNDPVPDIDVMYLGIPNDTGRGFFNWIDKGTYEITQSRDGITILSQVQEYDPKLAQAITETIKHIECHFGCHEQTKFNFVRSWDVFPGVVFNISAPLPHYGQLGFDINLYHETEYFGVEHTKRFISYLEHVRLELGEEIAAQLILDIRQVKQSAKDYVRDPKTGKIDKARKVLGIIFEALFTYSYPPPTRDEVSAMINNIDLASFPSVRSDTDYNFPIQVIDEKLPLKNVLDAGWEVGLLHRTNWETLLNAMRLNR